MSVKDLKIEEKNPLEPTAVSLSKKFLQSNKRGRPSSAKALKFTPQPTSIISRLLKRVREKNYDNDKKVHLSNIHNISNRRHNMKNMDDNLTLKKNSIQEEPKLINTYESIQENFSCDLTMLEDNHDNFKDNSLLDDDNKQNNYQSNMNTLWNKYEDKPKLLEIVCYVCSHRSINQQAHRKHLSTHRNQPYTCNFPNCKYSCKLSCNLIKHKRIHTSEKPYLCDQCTFRSNFANSLKVHKRIHTSERPYGCQHCSYRCNSSSNLKKHCLHKHRNMS